MFQASAQGMYDLVQRAPRKIADRDRPRLTRWAMAMECSVEAGAVRSLIFEMNASGKDLRDAELFGLHVARSRFFTDLRRARLVDSVVEASDFTYCDLRNTLWQHTHVRRSFFRNSSFVDACFNDVMFVECDLRGVDFTIDSLELAEAPAGITFVRCDLRETIWQGRQLDRLAVIDCRTSDAGDAASPIPARRADPGLVRDGHKELV
jgi:uncharacterized protein YjbI with pentapeptide repeats